MRVPDFREKIINYDILVFQETKLDDLDNDYVKQYFSSLEFDCNFKHRVPISSRESGGISVCVKKILSTKMCIYRTASKYVLWFSFNKMLHKR